MIKETNDKIFLKQLFFVNKASFPVNSVSVVITTECGEYKSLMNFEGICDIWNVSVCYALGPSIFAEESTTGSILMCQNCVSGM
jgi:hypothetical protein